MDNHGNVANAGIPTYPRSIILRSYIVQLYKPALCMTRASESIQLSINLGNHRMDCCYGLKRYMPRAVR
jgi:hypothetical protein